MLKYDKRSWYYGKKYLSCVKQSNVVQLNVDFKSQSKLAQHKFQLHGPTQKFMLILKLSD